MTAPAAPRHSNVHAAVLNTEPAGCVALASSTYTGFNSFTGTGFRPDAWMDIDLQHSAVLQSADACFERLTDSSLNCLLLANLTCPSTPQQHCHEWKRFPTHNHRHRPMPIHPAHNMARMQAVIRMFEHQGSDLLVEDRNKKHAACQGPRYDVTMGRMAELMQRLDPTDSSS
uniref:Uncharacterized protein n=1 Tax=Chlamydomonas euryale TaxID=1486919 RepID=A0A6U2JXE7_9CHLO